MPYSNWDITKAYSCDFLIKENESNNIYNNYGIILWVWEKQSTEESSK